MPSQKSVYQQLVTGIGHNSGLLPLPSSTIAEFIARHKISRSFFYKLQKEKRGPRLTRVNRKTLILGVDEIAWIEGLREDGQ